MTKMGSIVYQVVEALKTLFRPGHSRHRDKGRRLPDGTFKADHTIYGISTFKAYKKDCIRFCKYCKARWDIRDIRLITADMGWTYLDELAAKGRKGGYLSRIKCALQKLSLALHGEAWDLGGTWHSDPHPERFYTPEQAAAIVANVRGYARDPQTADVAHLQWVSGARVSEAVYVRGEDIDLEQAEIRFVKATKGGQVRVVTVAPEDVPFLRQLKQQAQTHRDGHVFHDRGTLAARTWREMDRACQRLDYPGYGTHALRKGTARERYEMYLSESDSDQAARLEVAEFLGHHRTDVVDNHYVPRHEQDESEA